MSNAFAVTTVLLLLVLVDIVGNSLVCAIIWKNRNLRYILSLHEVEAHQSNFFFSTNYIYHQSELIFTNSPKLSICEKPCDSNLCSFRVYILLRSFTEINRVFTSLYFQLVLIAFSFASSISTQLSKYFILKPNFICLVHEETKWICQSCPIGNLLICARCIGFGTKVLALVFVFYQMCKT